MSHATVLVSVEGTETYRPGLISKLVDEQMAPFDENDCMFRDGSRWDWYEIGGRWNGLLCPKNIIQVRALKEMLAKSGKPFPPHYAFLYHRTWHEQDRMGWWGMPAKTECEINHPEHKGKCLHTDKNTGAKIVSWGNDPGWDDKFYDRFVKNLPDTAWLVTVDYHV